MHSKKYTTIIGVGGHGSSAYIDLLTSGMDVNMIFGTDDYFGSSREIIEVFKRMDKSKLIMDERFNDQYFLLPMGDLRNNLVRIIKASAPDSGVAELMDFRSNDLAEITKAMQTLIEKLSLDVATTEIVNKFLNEYVRALEYEYDLILARYAKSRNDIQRLPAKSLGNLFLAAIYLASPAQESFFEHLRSIGMIPDNLNIYFLSERRTISIGRDIANKVVLGEDNIDHHALPIIPPSYGLYIRHAMTHPANREFESSDLNPKIKEIIADSHTLIFSTGSLANLMPQIRYLIDAINESDAEVIWLWNIFRTLNELEISLQAIYLMQLLERIPIILSMDNDLSKNIRVVDAYLQKYLGEGKVLNDVDTQLRRLIEALDDEERSRLQKRFLAVLDLIDASKLKIDSGELNETLERSGVKYKSESVTGIVLLLSEIKKRIMQELSFGREEQYNYLTEFLGALKLDRIHNSTLDHMIELFYEIITSSSASIDLKLEACLKAMNMCVENVDIEEIYKHFTEFIFEKFKYENQDR